MVILCELCIRYGVRTEVDGTIVREMEVENHFTGKKADFPVCECCAEELDHGPRFAETDE